MEAPKAPSLTKLEWKELYETLMLVPKTKRGASWAKAAKFVDEVLEHAIVDLPPPPMSSDAIHYAVECSICRKHIKGSDDYVYKAVDGMYVHYDCNESDRDV